MKITRKQNNSKLEHFRKLFEEAKLALMDTHEEFDRNMRQYLGSDEIDGGEKAITVRNITYEIIESQISSDIPVPKVDAACYSENRERCAKSTERLCYAIRESLPFEELNNLDERYTYIYGASVWYVEWDAMSGDGGVQVSCLSPKNFFGQPGISRPEDMEYCFLVFTTTRYELMRKYSVSESDAAFAECEYEYEGNSLSDAVNVIVSFYRDENGEIGRFIFSGDLVLSDIDRFYRRKMKICTQCGRTFNTCDCIDSSFKFVELETEEADGESLPFYTPKNFPIIIRTNTKGENSLFGTSDCKMIRPQQQAINKVESRILQKLLRAGVTPIIPEDSTVTLSNAIFGQVIKTRPGEKADSYGKLDTTPDISQDIAEADRLYEHAKRISGVTDALQGIDNTKSESGYARELKINRATSRLESKRRIKYLTYSELYKIIFQHYLAFADEPRSFAYKDTFGRIHLEEFSRRNFLEHDKYGTPYYCDDYLFSVDLNGGNEYQRELLWEKNLANLESGTLGNKENPTTLLRYWQSQERAHYPYARENVEYFKLLVENQNKNNTESENPTNEKEKPLPNTK